MTARVVCIGIATLDSIVLVDRLPEPGERMPARESRLAGGGVAATAAVTLARLGIPVAFSGRIGDDEAGEMVADDLARENVDTAGLRVVPGRTPVTVVFVEAETGERTLVPDTHGVPPIELTDWDVARCAEAEWVHLDQTGHPTLAYLRATGVRTAVSFDGGNVDREYDLRDVDLYAPTERALFARYPERSMADAIAAAGADGPDLVVVTRGENGSVAWDATSADVIESSGFGVQVTSTLGAGDVFHGALLAALLDGLDLRDALRHANAAAALSCRALDGRSAIPDRTELEAFLARAT
jgi:sugar/nucleoside kinase (ribokinase family)